MTPIRPLLLAAVTAASLTGCQKAQDEAFGQRVRTYLLAHPEVLEETVAALDKKKQLEQAKASAVTLDKLRAQLERDPRDPVLNPNGTVTVVEFFDYRCGYCKVVAPEVMELARQNPDVRFVFKEFPIFGEVSDSAAKIALTREGKSKTKELYQRWMSDKALDEAGLDRHLREVGLDPSVVREAAKNPQIERHLLDNRALAGALGIEGTPAFVVGDTLIPGADVAALKAAILQAKTKDLKRPGSPT